MSFITVKEAAEKLGLAASTIRRKAQNGEIEPRPLQRKNLERSSVLVRFGAEQPLTHLSKTSTSPDWTFPDTSS